jgi:uncharacterized protein YjiS (DUF1127 family)
MSCIAPERDRLAAPARAVAAHRWTPLGWSRVARPIRWLRQQWRRGAAIRELQRIDDRQLRDMGIDRNGIEAVIDELMRRDR